MKEKCKHSPVQRLHWKIGKRCWRAQNPEKEREIRKRYWKKRRERDREMRRAYAEMIREREAGENREQSKAKEVKAE